MVEEDHRLPVIEGYLSCPASTGPKEPKMPKEPMTEEYLKGFTAGFKEALATVGQDLRDNEFKEYSVEDYGLMYENAAKNMGDCVKCENVGSEKGCPVGKTIWCPRITETLDDMEI
jgi:hypothetical protein